MSRDVQAGTVDKAGAAPSHAPAAAAPGKATLAEQHGTDAGEQVAIAQQGLAGATDRLPFADQIQRSFGARHDISHVRARIGGQAMAAAEQLGAHAYAHGDGVAFGAPPDLHTAAHEAAHVLQQRDGVSFKGVDQPGDAHEAHADAVADAVVAGRSAEGLLDRRERGGASGQAVQRKAKHHGPHYAKVDRFNRKQERGRPQVGHTLALEAEMPRYSIESGTKSRPHDTLPAGEEIQINIAKVRTLTIDGKKESCVFTRSVNAGSAWAKLSDVKKAPGASAHLAANVNSQARKHQAKAPSKQLAKKSEHKEMQFKPATAEAHTGLALTGHVSSQSRSNYDHYLFRDKPSATYKPMHDGFYNVCLNLPQHGTPPVQADVALPHDRFFVITQRSVSLYEKKNVPDPSKYKGPDVKEKRRSTWVFGCLGKQVGGEWVPDRTRTGWVPRSVLEAV